MIFKKAQNPPNYPFPCIPWGNRPHVIHGSLAHLSPYHKQHLDLFGCFCAVQGCVQQSAHSHTQSRQHRQQQGSSSTEYWRFGLLTQCMHSVGVSTLNSMLSLMCTLIATRSPSFGLPSCAILSSSVISSSSLATTGVSSVVAASPSPSPAIITLYSRHLWGDFPPKTYKSPHMAAKLCALNIYFDRDNKLQIYHGNFLLMDNKHRKLFIKKVQICA